MPRPSRPPRSVVAERAVRYLRDHGVAVPSTEMAEAVLATKVTDETTATRVLETAFADDPRLVYREGTWTAVDTGPSQRALTEEEEPGPELDVVLLILGGDPPARGRLYRLLSVVGMRYRGDELVGAAVGRLDPPDPSAAELRRSLRELLGGAVPVLFDAPGCLKALERWMEEPLEEPIRLQQLGRDRLGLPRGHRIQDLAAALGIPWRDVPDTWESADAILACLRALRRRGESLQAMRRASHPEAPRIDWSRFAFDRTFLRDIPRLPGTYRFLDAEGNLIYVGKSRNLKQRLGSYFRDGLKRSKRVQRLIDSLHRIEIDTIGSDLEAMLREAEQITHRKPQQNVQRRYHGRSKRAQRLRSILILEPATPPYTLRAFLIREGRLVDRVGIGPRGGGLHRIERLLRDQFFSPKPGPSASPSHEVDVEIVVRWLAANRDRVVAFDPTHLKSEREVILRLRWFLAQGTLLDPEGQPWVPR